MKIFSVRTIALPVLFGVFLLVLGMVAVQPPTSAQALTNCTPSSLTSDSEEQAFLTLINQYRAQNGRAALAISSDLNRAASWMAQDMAIAKAGSSSLSHTDSLGRDFGPRIGQCDVPFTSAGENIAAGYTTAQQVFDGWKASAGHNANMLGSFTHIGIARYFNGSSVYGWYWATDFSTGGGSGGGGTPTTSPARITSPTPGSTLSGSSVTFTRDAGTGVQAYALQVGTSAGAGNLLQINSWTTTTATATNLPTNGSTVYVRVWSLINGAWQVTDQTFKAAVVSSGAKASITSPTQGSTLSGSTVTFTRNSGTGVSAWGLQVGTSPGAGDLLVVNSWTSTTATASNIPTNGSTIYVRLWSFLNGGWQITDYTYKAASTGGGSSVKAAITSPAPGSTLPGSTSTFTRNNGTGVSAWALQVGTSFGSGNLLQLNSWPSTTATATNLPTNGSTVYVRIWSFLNGAWQITDYTYRAAGQ